MSLQVASGSRRFYHPCSFCRRQAGQKLEAGPFKGWVVCGRQECGLRQQARAGAPRLARVLKEAA